MALAPFGATEPHGPHLPYGTDTMAATWLSEHLSAELKLALLPAVPYGVVSSLLAYPMAVTLSPETLREIASSMAELALDSGYKAVVYVNGHGGNTDILLSLIKELSRERQVYAALLEWWHLASDITRMVFSCEGGHAAVDEAAAVLANAPHLVEQVDVSPYTVTWRPGVRAYPSPAPVMLYSSRSSPTPPSREEASLYWKLVCRRAKLTLQEILEGWEALGLQLKPPAKWPQELKPPSPMLSELTLAKLSKLHLKSASIPVLECSTPEGYGRELKQAAEASSADITLPPLPAYKPTWLPKAIEEIASSLRRHKVERIQVICSRSLEKHAAKASKVEVTAL